MSDDLIRVILGSCMVCFLLIWKITTRYTLKKYLQDLLKFRTLLFASVQIIMALQLFDLLPLYALTISINTFIPFMAIVLALAGTSLAIWAKLTMKQNWGPPAQHEIQKQQKLVTTGPFAHTRNPIYVGLLLLFFGVELALGSFLALLVIPFAYLFYRAVLVEEKLLAKHFGKEFKTYASRVRRFL